MILEGVVETQQLATFAEHAHSGRGFMVLTPDQATRETRPVLVVVAQSEEELEELKELLDEAREE